MVLIKIGGSIITRPGGFPAVDVMERVAYELKDFKGKAIIVHGTGHVGKPPAMTYGYLKTKRLPKTKLKTALTIWNHINELTTTLTGRLNELGVPVLPMDNIHFFGLQSRRWNGRPLASKIDQLTKNGIIPLFAGNFLPLPNGALRILSSDELMLTIARLVKPEKVIFLTDVDGVLDNKGNLIQHFSGLMLNDIRVSANDVSGGMKVKMSTALEVIKYCNECVIASGTKKHVLRRFLITGSTRGTKVLKKTNSYY